jgi:hypothetical protein
MPKVFPSWPAWRYGPNGEAAIFLRPEDVPEGWKDTQTAHFEPPPAPTPAPMERWEVVAALKGRGVSFKRNAPTSVLYAQLKAAGDGDGERTDNGSASGG